MMNDLISRQAAIDRINKQREHLQPDIYPQDKIGDAAYRICAEFIGRLPSAQPEQRWIPCEKCIHADGKHRWCKVLDRSINEDYFCYWAEPFRGEGEADGQR